MDKLLAGKVAFITGGTRGIGKEICLRFLQEGASIAFFGTNASLGKAVEEEFLASFSGQKVRFYALDVSQFSLVQETFGEAIEEFGKVDILINNAGITRDNLLLKLSLEEWEEVIDTNLSSLFNTCKAVLKPMLKARKGKILNVTSVVGLMGNAGQSNYAASKAGMIGFSKSLAKEYASRNICVNCVAPGFIQTAMTDQIPPQIKENFLNSIPLHRFGEGKEVADALLFLASPLADYITGQVIAVDGGLTC